MRIIIAVIYSFIKRHTFIIYTGIALLVTNPAFSLESTKSTGSSSTLPGLQNILNDQAGHYHEQANESRETTDNNPLSGADKMVGHVRGLYDKVVTEGLKSKLLDPVASYKLPLAISKQVLNTEQLIIIDSVVFTPGGAYLNAAASIDYPSEPNKRIAFYGANIGFHRGGFGGNARIHLVNENFSVGSLNDNITLSLTGTNKQTFVEFDCNGFQQFGIDARVSFSRDVILPVDGQGEILQGDQKVTASFTQTMVDWSELMVETSISPFQVKGLKDFVFSVSNLSLDMSDIANPGALAFPAGYPSAKTPLWHGVFIRELTVQLPPCFKSSSTKTAPQISARHFIIDENGVTGLFEGTNLLPLNEGSMSGWAFSLDSIKVALFTSTLNACNFSGNIGLPLGEQDNLVKYTGRLDFDGNYFFSLEQMDEVHADMWLAKLSLGPGSRVDVTVANKKFRPAATLNGDLTIAGTSSQKISVNGIEFQELCLQTVKPYVSAKAFALKGNSRSMGSGFPISLNEVNMVSDEDDIGIGLGVTLNLTGANAGSFGADTRFTVWATPKDNSRGIIAYKYKKIQLHNIGIDLDAGAFKIDGELIVYEDDPVYGQGYSGRVNVWFLPGFTLQSAAQFGNVNEFRYWYVDAKLGIPTGIPVFPGLSIYGFGGGASMHMSRQQPNNMIVLPNDPCDQAPEAPSPGTSLSGVTYTPDKNAGLGVRANVTAGSSGKPEAYNVKAGFEMIFHANGGLKQLSMDGDAGIMSPVEAPPDQKNYYGTVHMTYDVTNKSFFCNSQLYMSVAGGVIKGSGPGNLVGTAEILFSKNNWYIYVGTPQERVSITLMSMIKTKSYFMTGQSIPPMPDIDPRITNVIDRSPSRSGSLTDINGNPGFAFGSSMGFDTDKLKAGPFYAEFEALMGYDVMLKNFGKTTCEGRSGPVGINGWYATGQAYAYLKGEIGIKINMKMHKGKYEILEGEFGAVLQAEMPNPTWMKGEVGGHYSILEGLISGNCHFEFELGEKCQVSDASALAGVDIISTLTPANAEKDVSVYNSPQAVFNMQINKTFYIENMDGTTKTVKIALDKFYLESNGTKLKGDIRWNSTKDVASIKTHEILPPEKSAKLYAKVKFMEFKNGSWRPIKDDQGKDAYEDKTSEFDIGKAPPYISPHNIQYCYPLDRQKNVYKNESSKGYIQLNYGRADLFKHDPDWEKFVRFSDGANTIKSTVAYHVDDKRVEFPLPDRLANSKVYHFDIVNKPLESVVSTDQNVADDKKDLTGGAKYAIEANVKKAEGTIDYFEEEIIYHLDFATSKYNSFSDKMANLSIVNVQPWFVGETGVYSIYSEYQCGEPFDKYEIDGYSDTTAPLVRFRMLADNTWYNDYIYPVIYEHLPIRENIDLPASRYSDHYGVPPLNAAYLYQYDKLLLTQSEIKSNTLTTGSIRNYIHYHMPRITNKDYTMLKNDCSGYYLNSDNQALKDIIEIRYKNPYQGNYKIQFEYYLPGKRSRNASATKEFFLDL